MFQVNYMSHQQDTVETASNLMLTTHMLLHGDLGGQKSAIQYKLQTGTTFSTERKDVKICTLQHDT